MMHSPMNVKNGTGNVFITLQVRPLKHKWHNTAVHLNMRHKSDL